MHPFVRRGFQQVLALDPARLSGQDGASPPWRRRPNPRAVQPPPEAAKPPPGKAAQQQTQLDSHCPKGKDPTDKSPQRQQEPTERTGPDRCRQRSPRLAHPCSAQARAVNAPRWGRRSTASSPQIRQQPTERIGPNRCRRPGESGKCPEVGAPQHRKCTGNAGRMNTRHPPERTSKARPDLAHASKASPPRTDKQGTARPCTRIKGVTPPERTSKAQTARAYTGRPFPSPDRHPSGSQRRTVQFAGKVPS